MVGCLSVRPSVCLSCTGQHLLAAVWVHTLLSAIVSLDRVRMHSIGCGLLQRAQCVVTGTVCLSVCVCLSVGLCLQCFDAVGWVSGRASGVQKLSDELLLVWLSVWSEVQIVCTWSS